MNPSDLDMLYPVDEISGKLAAQLPNVLYIEYSKCLVAHPDAFDEAARGNMPAKPSAADWAFVRAVTAKPERRQELERLRINKAPLPAEPLPLLQPPLQLADVRLTPSVVLVTIVYIAVMMIGSVCSLIFVRSAKHLFNRFRMLFKKPTKLTSK